MWNLLQRSVDKETWLIPKKLWARRGIIRRGSRISLKSSWDLATSSEYELRLNRQHNYLNWSKLIQQSETGYDLSFLTSLVRISESKLHDAFMKMSWSLSNEKMIIVEKNWVTWNIEINRGVHDNELLKSWLNEIIMLVKWMVMRLVSIWLRG